MPSSNIGSQIFRSLFDYIWYLTALIFLFLVISYVRSAGAYDIENYLLCQSDSSYGEKPFEMAGGLWLASGGMVIEFVKRHHRVPNRNEKLWFIVGALSITPIVYSIVATALLLAKGNSLEQIFGLAVQAAHSCHETAPLTLYTYPFLLIFMLWLNVGPISRLFLFIKEYNAKNENAE